ncbi:MAG: bifunctional phosphoglucose/phosphomannose isomerase [Bacteroidota bacterium]
MTIEQIQTIDPSNMYGLIMSFPRQVQEAVAIGYQSRVRLSPRGIREIVLCGLGGSAIGGDLLKSYLAGELTVPFLVNRYYTLPAFVGPTTLVIISSYSGNTEETTTAFREALRKKARILCISSNGLTEKIARKRNVPLIKIPGGLPPRAALGYSFFPLLIALSKSGFIKDRKKDIQETITLLTRKAEECADPTSDTNPALRLAQLFQNRLGIVYSSTERFDAVNTRWRGQMAENAKTLTFGHVLPEMNHNELVGWKTLTALMRETQVIFLRDKDDYRRVQVRMDVTKAVLEKYTDHVTEVWSEGRSLLARMFSLVHLADWTSFYTAILHGVDPTPVEVIDYLKSELGKV